MNKWQKFYSEAWSRGFSKLSAVDQATVLTVPHGEEAELLARFAIDEADELARTFAADPAPHDYNDAEDIQDTNPMRGA